MKTAVASPLTMHNAQVRLTLACGRFVTHYEVHVAAREDAPFLVLVTRDVALYELALSLEGTDTRVTVRWHVEQTQTEKGKRRVQVLDGLEVAA